jgi:hypothetical protein
VSDILLVEVSAKKSTTDTTGNCANRTAAHGMPNHGAPDAACDGANRAIAATAAIT